MRHFAYLLAFATIAFVPSILFSSVSAQQAEPERQGRTAEVSGGEVGQRQEEDADPMISSMGRIENRIQNRLQNRIRNRIDRNYDPGANATSPYEEATDEARAAGEPRPR